jgi:hypothetical protein
VIPCKYYCSIGLLDEDAYSKDQGLHTFVAVFGGVLACADNRESGRREEDLRCCFHLEERGCER